MIDNTLRLFIILLLSLSSLILNKTNYPVPYVGIVKKHKGTSNTEDREFSILITENELNHT